MKGCRFLLEKTFQNHTDRSMKSLNRSMAFDLCSVNIVWVKLTAKSTFTLSTLLHVKTRLKNQTNTKISRLW